MNDFEVINGGKKRSGAGSQKKVLGMLRSIMIVLIILMVLFVFAKLLSNRGSINNSANTTKNPNYIYEIASDAVLDMQSCNGGLVVLTPTNVLYINRSGSNVSKNPHKYSEPAISVSGDRVLLFDRGSNSFRIENSGGVQFDSKTEQPILDASFGKKGGYALATKASDALSTLFVYNRKHQLTFQWKCASEYISCVDLSPNGKYASAVVINAKNAAMYSKVYLFRLTSSEPMACHDFESVVFSAKFVSKRKLSVVAEDMLCIVSAKDRKDAFTYSALSDRRATVDRAGGNTAILLAKYGNDNSDELYVYGDNAKLLLKKGFVDKIGWIDCSGSYGAVAYDANAEIYNFSGRTVGSISFDTTVDRILLDGTNIYVLTSSGISVYGITSHVSVSNVVPENTTAAPTQTPIEPDANPGKPIAAFTEAGLTQNTAEG